jgi:hypothetical protein
MFIFAIASRPAVGPTQVPTDTEGSVPGIKLPSRETDHLSPSTVEVTIQGELPPLPRASSLRGFEAQERQLKRIRCEDVDWVQMAQDRILVNTVMELCVP